MTGTGTVRNVARTRVTLAGTVPPSRPALFEPQATITATGRGSAASLMRSRLSQSSDKANLSVWCAVVLRTRSVRGERYCAPPHLSVRSQTSPVSSWFG